MGDNLFAQRLSIALSTRQMKPIELASKSGIDKAAISQYLSGKYKAKQDNIFALSKVLNVNPEWLMGYDVPMEKEIPYSAIYDFSNESDKKLLNTAIVYAIQNSLTADSIRNNDYIKDCINSLSHTDKSKMLAFITKIATDFKGKDDFNLEEYIQSLRYKNAEDDNYTQEIRAIARDVAKLKPEKKELFKNLLKQMSDEADEASKK